MKKRIPLKRVLLLALAVIFLSGFAGKPVMAFEGGYDKGFFLASNEGDFKTKINFQLQPQYQFLSVEGQGKTNGLQIRRGRISFEGHAFTESLTYDISFEFVGGRNNVVAQGAGFAGPSLRDAFLNYNFGNGVEIQVGQFKQYFNREELTSSKKLQFVDRSINNEVFGLGRDLGLGIHGEVLDKKLEYGVYVANDGGNRNTSNRNDIPLLGGRAVWNVFGDHGYTMSDPNHSDKNHLAVGIGTLWNRVLVGTADQTLLAATADIAFRRSGFSALGEGNVVRNHTASASTFGFLAQTGYFLVSEKLEVAARFAGVIPRVTATNGYEAGGAINYFLKGHNVKLQTDYNLLINSPLSLVTPTNNPTNVITAGAMGAAGAGGFVQNQNDHRLRTQLQLYF